MALIIVTTLLMIAALVAAARLLDGVPLPMPVRHTRREPRHRAATRGWRATP